MNDHFSYSNNSFLLEHDFDVPDDIELDPCLFDKLSDVATTLEEIENTTSTDDFTLYFPDTPPSSDRSTPPNILDVNSPLFTTNFHQPPPSSFPTKINSLRPILPAFHLPNAKACTILNTVQKHGSTNGHHGTHRHDDNKSSVQKKLELSQQKKEARMARNRESANLSRKKQKEYVQELEAKISELVKENHSLKEENQLLKNKVSHLENESLNYAKSDFNFVGKKRKTLSLLAIVFMLCCNLAPFSGVFISDNEMPRKLEKQSNHRNGRSLLWTNNDGLSEDKTFYQNKSELLNRFANSSADPNCNMYINKTESLRLENELRNLIYRVDKENKAQGKKRNPKQKLTYKKPPPLTRMKAILHENSGEYNGLDLYTKNIDQLGVTYKNLFDAIHRRDDTFYFVTFTSGDHLLLPAETNKTNVRPRISLVMPALSTINETSDSGKNSTYNQLAMMQIDCEVINTRVVVVRNLVPTDKHQEDNLIQYKHAKTFRINRNQVRKKAKKSNL